MTGFPLQFYSRLDELRQAYENDLSLITRSNDECHIDFNEASDNLPDITNYPPRPTPGFGGTSLRSPGHDHRGDQLEAGRFQVRVPNEFHTGYVDVKLGSRLNRAVKTACEQPHISDYLRDSWDEWVKYATPRRLAALYVSSRKTHKELEPDLNAARHAIRSSPLRNCFEEIAKEAERLLNRTDEGKAWLQAVAPRRLELHGPSSSDNGGEHASNGDSLADKIENCACTG